MPKKSKKLSVQKPPSVSPEELAEKRWSSYKPWRIFHWGPLTALTIIFSILYFTIFCNLMFWPLQSKGGFINLSIFSTWVFLILYHHFQAQAVGPGFVRLGWKPKNPDDCRFLQYCKFCEGYKAPRSHHCRRCNRCVMKMDHHCPWINTCCGHMNHAHFTYFLFFAPVGCMHAFYILVSSLYYGFNWRYYLQHGTGHEPRIFFTMWSLIGTLFAAGLAIGVTISVGILLIVQLKSVWKNETGIENWIIRKEEYRLVDEEEEGDKGANQFVYPYHLGVWRNFRQVFTWSGWPRSDGITWEVLPGCDQYTLTRAQLKQKQDKKLRSTTYKIIKPASGWWFPLLSQGVCVCLNFPWSDEPRLALQEGDTVLVTRHRSRWLYGEKVISLTEGEYRRERGWFPRRCAAQKSEEEAD